MRVRAHGSHAPNGPLVLAVGGVSVTRRGSADSLVAAVPVLQLTLPGRGTAKATIVPDFSGSQIFSDSLDSAECRAVKPPTLPPTWQPTALAGSLELQTLAYSLERQALAGARGLSFQRS
jgi:hypothetical protein